VSNSSINPFLVWTDCEESKFKDSSFEGAGKRGPHEEGKHLGSKSVDQEINVAVAPCHPSVIDLFDSNILSQQQHQQNQTFLLATSHENNPFRHVPVDLQQLRNMSINDDSWNAVVADFLHDAISNVNDEDDECGSVHSFDSLEYYDRRGMLLVPLKPRVDN
jgi:hypothetical protein